MNHVQQHTNDRQNFPKDYAYTADTTLHTVMKSKVEGLGRIKREFPARGKFQLFHLEKPATFFCAFRKVEVTSAKVALNLQTGELLSNGAYGQLLAGH